MKKILLVFTLLLIPFIFSACSLIHQHEFSEWKITQSPTCVQDGVQERTCVSCGEIKTQVLNATGEHNYNYRITGSVTCVKDGEKTYTCVNCGNTYKEVVPATGTHNYTSEITKDATCVETGTKKFTCTDCKHSYTEAIPVTNNHAFSGTKCLWCNAKNPVADDIASALEDIERYVSYTNINKRLIENEYELFCLTYDMDYYVDAHEHAVEICNYLQEVIELFEDYTDESWSIETLVKDCRECIADMPQPPLYLSNSSARSYILKCRSFATTADRVFVFYENLCERYGVQ